MKENAWYVYWIDYTSHKTPTGININSPESTKRERDCLFYKDEVWLIFFAHGYNTLFHVVSAWF